MRLRAAMRMGANINLKTLILNEYQGD